MLDFCHDLNHWSYSNSCKTATQGFFKEVIYAGCLLSSKAKSSIQRPFISKTALSNEWMNEWMNDLFDVEDMWEVFAQSSEPEAHVKNPSTN